MEARSRVLIVDRSRIIRAALSKSIRDRFDVREVPDARNGWQELLSDGTVRAVIANLDQLKADDFSLVRRMRASRIPRVRDMPVIVFSGGEYAEADAIISSLGIKEVIGPGVEPVELKARLAGRIASARRRIPVLTDVVKRPKASVSAAPAPVVPVRQKSPEPKVHPVKDSPQPDVKPGSESNEPHMDKEASMTRLDNLNKVLKNLQSRSPGVEASALISEDGLMIASALSADLDGLRVAGMTATLLNLGTRAATELQRGGVQEVIVRGEKGYAVMINAGRGALLLVLASEETPLGLIFFDMRESIKSIKDIL
jgi:predicted regulator of Ras-like GTPase activity (Roadblock/LC7/MglB family)/DNA-binding NarL/FixJ family response regulator